jgi:hypothetical protein
LLPRPHGSKVRPLQCQHHRFNRLALNIRELPAQIKRTPLALLAALKQVMKEGMISHELLGHRGKISWGQIHLRLLATGRGLCLQAATLALPFLAHHWLQNLTSPGKLA